MSCCLVFLPRTVLTPRHPVQLSSWSVPCMLLVCAPWRQEPCQPQLPLDLWRLPRAWQSIYCTVNEGANERELVPQISGPFSLSTALSAYTVSLAWQRLNRTSFSASSTFPGQHHRTDNSLLWALTTTPTTVYGFYLFAASDKRNFSSSSRRRGFRVIRTVL